MDKKGNTLVEHLLSVSANAIGGRWICDILHDMRECNKTRNYSFLNALIEELQYRASRMEDRLMRIKDVKAYEEKRNDLKREIEVLEEKQTSLQEEIKVLEHEKR